MFRFLYNKLYLVWYGHREWSAKTFGSPEYRGPVGSAKHLKKEVDEFLEEYLANGPSDKAKMEGIDLLMLSFDVLFRMGMSYDEIVEFGSQKLEILKSRKWVIGHESEPAEHDRSFE